MQTTKYFLISFLFGLMILAPATNFGKGERAAQTPGDVTFTFKTVTANGNYSPKHVLAVWVEDANGFVKSRLVQAQQRKQYLYTWIAASNQNSVDATTGATLTSHQQRTVTWDCKDLSGNLVQDGNYTLKVEFTDQHAQGPIYSISFVKGTSPVHLTPANQNNFINIDLQYNPDAPLSAFEVNHLIDCTNNPFVFSDASLQATSWDWNFGADAVPQTANTAGPHEVYYTSPGYKTVSLTINGSVQNTQANLISVLSAPTAAFSYTLDGSTIHLTNESQNSSLWFWDFGDGSSSNEQNPSHTYLSEGPFLVSLIAGNEACNSISLDSLIQFTQNIYPSRRNPLTLYPNPAYENTTISIEGIINPDFSFRIYNMKGQEIDFNHNLNSDNQSISIDTHGIQSGIYWICVKEGATTWNAKFLIL